MNVEREQAVIRRLTMALDTAICEGVDFEGAAELAALLGAELHALFVEDPDLVALAALPVAREVARVGARARQPDRAEVLASLRRQVQRAESGLARAGASRTVTVSFRTERGKILRCALAEGESVGIVLLPGACEPVRRRMTAIPTRPRPVFAWFEATDQGRSTLNVAARIARHAGSGLFIGFRADESGADDLLRRLVRESADLRAGEVWLRPFAFPRAAVLADAAAGVRAGQIVLGVGGPLASEASLAELFRRYAATLVLVRG